MGGDVCSLGGIRGVALAQRELGALERAGPWGCGRGTLAGLSLGLVRQYRGGDTHRPGFISWHHTESPDYDQL